MTAPARTAAFRALVAIASNHRDLPTALVESRVASRTSGIARLPRPSFTARFAGNEPATT